jgi:hypothetical protein
VRVGEGVGAFFLGSICPLAFDPLADLA